MISKIGATKGKHRVRRYKDHPSALVQSSCKVEIDGKEAMVRFVVSAGSVYVRPSGEFASLFGGRDIMLSKYGKTKLQFVCNNAFDPKPDDLVHDGEFVLLADIERAHRGHDRNSGAWAKIREQADRDALLRKNGDKPDASKAASKRWDRERVGEFGVFNGRSFVPMPNMAELTGPCPKDRPPTLAEKVAAKIASESEARVKFHAEFKEVADERDAALAELKSLKTEVMEAYTMPSQRESLAALEIIAERIAKEGGRS